jgi:hypothetical protein
MRHLFVVLFVCFWSTLSVFGQDTTPDDAKVIEYIVTADTANLRSGPGTNFSTSGVVSKGESLLIYDEPAEQSGWLKIYREGEDDAYIADFLVEKAPTRFYPVNQEPVVSITQRGKSITQVLELPASAYRLDVVVEDNAFILKSVVIEGDCRDATNFNILDLDRSRLVASALLVSSGCSIVFESDNVDSEWTLEIRDLLDTDFLLDSILEVEDETTISGTGQSLTMPTRLPPGVWTISATVNDRAFILHARVLVGECEETAVFNELDFDARELEGSSMRLSPHGERKDGSEQ